MSARGTLRRLVGAIALLSFLHVTSPATAADESVDERKMLAQSLFDDGQRVADSNPKGALAAFRASYEVLPDFRVLYNIGRTLARLGDGLGAARAYERYLAEGADKVPAPRRREVEAQLKVLTRNLGQITVRSSAKEAELRIDGVRVGRSPFGHPISLPTGSHKVTLVADGRGTDMMVRVHAGSSQALDFDPKEKEPEPVALPAAAPPPPPASAPPAEPVAPPPPPVLTTTAAPIPSSTPILPWVVTAGLATGAAVTGLLTLDAEASYDAKRNEYPVTRSDLDDAHARAQRLFFATSAFAVGTVVALGVATYMTWFRSRGAPAEPRVGVTVVPGRVGLGGSFH